jgi:hypothetical protein
LRRAEFAACHDDGSGTVTVEVPGVEDFEVVALDRSDR